MVTSVKKQQTEIQSAVVYRVTSKSTHENFYLVQSDSQAEPHVWYEVHFNHVSLLWCCNCGDPRRSCKHSRAVGEVLKIRRQRIAAAMGPLGEIETVVAYQQLQDEHRQARAEQQAERITDPGDGEQRRQTATLNYRNQGFVLLK